jgi:hypothetical protein
MAVTVLSGTSGALYYKPAGTKATFPESAVTVADDEITVASYLNFKVGDPVVFSVVNVNTGNSGTGTLPAGITAGTTYYVIAYTASTGVLQVSATSGGSSITITDDGTAVSPNAFQVEYADYAAVGQVQNWSFEITRDEIDVTTIGQTAGQYAPFRAYIPGFADGSGSASVFITDDDTTLANRLIEDVLQAKQAGASFRLYMDKLSSEALSRSITFEAALLSASFSVNPDDAQVVEVTFRPTAAPTIDLSKS